MRPISAFYNCGARGAGVRSIMSGLAATDEGEELGAAEESMEEAERTGKILAGERWFKSFWQAASIIFMAEWGDRSMLATIALAVHANPYGVAFGATMGHVLATAIAVAAGSLASKHISEKTVNLVGGVLFLFFAVETGLGLGIL
jgi:putative Ca2+/H+ antiporter (TMEM165/GDT1 family)